MESAEKITYYYANFNIFADESQDIFLRYNRFKHKLTEFLGPEWNLFAKKALFQIQGATRTCVDGELLFDASLESWLELRKEINTSAEKMAQDDKFEDMEVFETFCKNVRAKFANYAENPSAWKAVMQAFFISSGKVWSHINTMDFDELDRSINSDKMNEEKKSDENKPDNTFLTRLKNLTKETAANSALIRPLWVATEKIMSYLEGGESKKKVHTEDESAAEEEKQMKDEKKNIENFKSNMQIEYGDDIKEKMKKLSLEDPYDSTGESGAHTPGRDDQSTGSHGSRDKKMLEVKKLGMKRALLTPSMISGMYKHINEYIDNSYGKWQLSANFVIKIVEVNYNNFMKLEKKLMVKTSDIKNSINIRFIQPAKDFYNMIMDVWVISQCKRSIKEIIFEDFIRKTKVHFGDKWDEKYIKPAMLVFQTMMREWNDINKGDISYNDKIKLFLAAVRGSLQNLWDKYFVTNALKMKSQVLSVKNHASTASS